MLGEIEQAAQDASDWSCPRGRCGAARSRDARGVEHLWDEAAVRLVDPGHDGDAMQREPASACSTIRRTTARTSSSGSGADSTPVPSGRLGAYDATGTGRRPGPGRVGRAEHR